MLQDTLRLLAFYLPQFHPIPENDEWWGKGFTEWTNVARARSLFPGHFQPHLPADLGFYDLRLAETRQAQADLARAYGLSGFVYYHYWFNGKQLLERPFDEVLSSRQPDFPFCLCWANENWTRVWDGHNREILIAQEYSPEDDEAHIQWLVRAFRDERYIRVGNRPLLLVYRAHALPDPLRTTSLWRQVARQNGIDDLYLCAVASHAPEHEDPTPLGFDAAVQFQPDAKTRGPTLSNPSYSDHIVYDYSLLVQLQLNQPAPAYRLYPGVTPGWDNSARRRSGATIFVGSTPRLYEAWLNNAICRARQNPPGEQLVFINAWNEWAEGNHLEPDLYWGHQYLEATRRAASGLSGEQIEGSDVGTVAHQRELIALLERERLDMNRRLEVVDRWSHELEEIVHAHERNEDRLRRLAGPLAPLARWLLRTRR